MIYSVYWARTSMKEFRLQKWDVEYRPKLKKFEGELINYQAIFADVIKESKEDSFVFIVTNSQLPSFDQWVADYKLEDYLVYGTPRGVTNGSHPNAVRNLNLRVMASKEHVWRDMYELGEEDDN